MTIPLRSTRLANKIESATGIHRILDADIVALARKRARETSTVPGHRNLWELGGKVGWGEVLGYNRFYKYPISRVVYDWMHSPTHKEILMDKSYPYIGTGVYVVNTRWYFCAIVTTGPV